MVFLGIGESRGILNNGEGEGDGGKLSALKVVVLGETLRSRVDDEFIVSTAKTE